MKRFAILLALSAIHVSASYAIGIEAKPSFVPKDPSKKPPNYVDLTYCCHTGNLVPCQMTFTWEAMPQSGGHLHQGIPRTPGKATVIRPISGASSGCFKGSCPPGSLQTTSDFIGYVTLRFEPPEAASIIRICWQNNQGFGDCDFIDVKVKDLQRLTFPPSSLFHVQTRVEEGYKPGPNGHSAGPLHEQWEGHGTAGVSQAMRLVESRYAMSIAAYVASYPTFQPHPVWITAVSMKYGGLADIRAGHEWIPPHWEHRFGQQVDIGVQNLSGFEKQSLVHALSGVLTFTVPGESPNAPGVNHWHVAP